MNREVLRYKQRLDNLINRIDSFSGDEELHAHLVRYMCVIVCGFLEVSVPAIYNEYAQEKAMKYVANYVNRQLGSFRSPNMERILGLAGAFSPEWRDKLENATSEVIKDSINSIVANRHLIAHGRSVGITIGRMKRYYKDAVKLIKLIERQCNQ